MVQWLHISDLHFQPNTDPDQESLIRALLADCRSRKIQADFVAATGDFHNFWDTGNYLASWRFLHTLMEALGLDITRDLFLVPGNHDVNPVEGADPVQAFLTQAQADCRDLHYACTLTKHGDLLNPLLERFRSYRAMAGALLPVYGADGLGPGWRPRASMAGPAQHPAPEHRPPVQRGAGPHGRGGPWRRLQPGHSGAAEGRPAHPGPGPPQLPRPAPHGEGPAGAAV